MSAYTDATGFVGAGIAGGMAGREVILRAGWKAAGMMGGGSGVGTSAMRAGVAFGALAGLSLYGVGRTAVEVHREAKRQIHARRTPPEPVEQPE